MTTVGSVSLFQAAPTYQFLVGAADATTGAPSLYLAVAALATRPSRGKGNVTARSCSSGGDFTLFTVDSLA